MSTPRTPIFTFHATGLDSVAPDDLQHDFADHLNIVNGLVRKKLLTGTYSPGAFCEFESLVDGARAQLGFHGDEQSLYDNSFASGATLAYLFLVEQYYESVTVSVTGSPDLAFIDHSYHLARQINRVITKPEWLVDLEREQAFQIDRPAGLDFRS